MHGRVALVIWMCAVAACSSSAGSNGATSPEGGGVDAATSDAPHPVADGGAGDDGAPDAPSYAAAAHPPLPQVPNNGGPVLAHMNLLTITFAGYPYTADVQAFGGWLVTSSWLSTVGAEYGVGSGTSANIVLTDTPPASASTGDIESFLAQKITSGALPQPQPETLYVIYYPASTQVAGLGCSGPWWGHNTVASPVHFTYAAIPACPPPAAEGWSQIESIEQDASHEIIEAATDPEYYQAPAYTITDPESPWHYLGTEIADFCVGLVVQEGAFFAQRAWSNQAAASGGVPCVPAPPGAAMFDVSPATSTPLTIAAGGSRTVSVTGWSTAADEQWFTVALQYPGFTATLSPTATINPASFANGATGQVTISVPSGSASGSRGVVVLESATLGPGNVIAEGPFEWPIMVQVP